MDWLCIVRRTDELLEVLVFGEDVFESLIHHIVRANMSEGSILIDEVGGGLLKRNGGCDFSAGCDLKQWHGRSPYSSSLE